MSSISHFSQSKHKNKDIISEVNWMVNTKILNISNINLKQNFSKLSSNKEYRKTLESLLYNLLHLYTVSNLDVPLLIKSNGTLCDDIESLLSTSFSRNVKQEYDLIYDILLIYHTEYLEIQNKIKNNVKDKEVYNKMIISMNKIFYFSLFEFDYMFDYYYKFIDDVMSFSFTGNSQFPIVNSIYGNKHEKIIYSFCLKTYDIINNLLYLYNSNGSQGHLNNGGESINNFYTCNLPNIDISQLIQNMINAEKENYSQNYKMMIENFEKYISFIISIIPIIKLNAYKLFLKHTFITITLNKQFQNNILLVNNNNLKELTTGKLKILDYLLNLENRKNINKIYEFEDLKVLSVNYELSENILFYDNDYISLRNWIYDSFNFEDIDNNYCNAGNINYISNSENEPDQFYTNDNDNNTYIKLKYKQIIQNCIQKAIKNNLMMDYLQNYVKGYVLNISQISLIKEIQHEFNHKITNCYFDFNPLNVININTIKNNKSLNVLSIVYNNKKDNFLCLGVIIDTLQICFSHELNNLLIYSSNNNKNKQLSVEQKNNFYNEKMEIKNAIKDLKPLCIILSSNNLKCIRMFNVLKAFVDINIIFSPFHYCFELYNINFLNDTHINEAAVSIANFCTFPVNEISSKLDSICELLFKYKFCGFSKGVNTIKNESINTSFSLKNKIKRFIEIEIIKYLNTPNNKSFLNIFNFFTEQNHHLLQYLNGLRKKSPKEIDDFASEIIQKNKEFKDTISNAYSKDIVNTNLNSSNLNITIEYYNNTLKKIEEFIHDNDSYNYIMSIYGKIDNSPVQNNSLVHNNSLSLNMNLNYFNENYIHLSNTSMFNIIMQKIPLKFNDVIYVKITNIQEDRINCQLFSDNLRGMILFSDIKYHLNQFLSFENINALPNYVFDTNTYSSSFTSSMNYIDEAKNIKTALEKIFKPGSLYQCQIKNIYFNFNNRSSSEGSSVGNQNENINLQLLPLFFENLIFEINDYRMKSQIHNDNNNKVEVKKFLYSNIIKSSFFHCFNYNQCINSLATKSNGSYIFRPSMKGDDYITLSLLLDNTTKSCLHNDLKIISNDDKITFELVGTDLVFNSLNDVIIRYFKKIYYQISLITNNNNYVGFSQSLNDFEKKLAKKLNVNKVLIPYFSILQTFPLYSIVGYYLNKTSVLYELIEITVNGINFHNQKFETFDQVNDYIFRNLGNEEYENGMYTGIKKYGLNCYTMNMDIRAYLEEKFNNVYYERSNSCFVDQNEIKRGGVEVSKGNSGENICSVNNNFVDKGQVISNEMNDFGNNNKNNFYSMDKGNTNNQSKTTDINSINIVNNKLNWGVDIKDKNKNSVQKPNSNISFLGKKTTRENPNINSLNNNKGPSKPKGGQPNPSNNMQNVKSNIAKENLKTKSNSNNNNNSQKETKKTEGLSIAQQRLSQIMKKPEKEVPLVNNDYHNIQAFKETDLGNFDCKELDNQSPLFCNEFDSEKESENDENENNQFQDDNQVNTNLNQINELNDLNNNEQKNFGFNGDLFRNPNNENEFALEEENNFEDKINNYLNKKKPVSISESFRMYRIEKIQNNIKNTNMFGNKNIDEGDIMNDLNIFNMNEGNKNNEEGGI